MRAFITAFFVLFICSFGYSQTATTPPAGVDTILLNNGKVLATQVIDTIGENITIMKPNSRKHKKVEISKEAIFSVRFASNGKEEVYYTYDTLINHDYTVADARKFIEGEQDAQKGYHALPASIMAFSVGFAAGTVFGSSLISLGPPFLFAGVMTYPRIKVRHKSVKNLSNGTSDPYLFGYDSTARRKRTLHSFVYGGLGIIFGAILNGILNNN